VPIRMKRHEEVYFSIVRQQSVAIRPNRFRAIRARAHAHASEVAAAGYGKGRTRAGWTRMHAQTHPAPESRLGGFAHVVDLVEHNHCPTAAHAAVVSKPERSARRRPKRGQATLIHPSKRRLR
jgi:hypothetical protein